MLSGVSSTARNSQATGGAGGETLPILCIPKNSGQGVSDMSEFIKARCKALRPLRLTGMFVVRLHAFDIDGRGR